MKTVPGLRPPPITTSSQIKCYTLQERSDNGDEASEGNATYNLESWDTVDSDLAWLGRGNGSHIGGSLCRCNNLNLSIRDLGDRDWCRCRSDWLGGGSLDLSVGDLADWSTGNAGGRLHA
jgi:hypothetical protein